MINVTELGQRVKGTIIPVTTPFTENDVVDYDALRELMRFYLESGIKAFIAAGSTGQCYALSEDEHRQVVRAIVEECKNYDDSFVLGACSHTSTAVSNRLADICQEEGVNALLMTPPYYRTHRDMCIMHYRDVASKHEIPLIIYHDEVMPEDLEMWDEIVKEPNILGVKFATANTNFGVRIIERYRGRLAVFGGNGMMKFLLLALHGAVGYVAGYANFIPQIEKDFFDFIEKGDFVSAARIAELEIELFDGMGNNSWFNYLVALINAAGLPGRYCRSPLPDVMDEENKRLKKFISDAKKKHKKIMDELSNDLAPQNCTS